MLNVQNLKLTDFGTQSINANMTSVPAAGDVMTLESITVSVNNCSKSLNEHNSIALNFKELSTAFKRLFDGHTFWTRQTFQMELNGINFGLAVRTIKVLRMTIFRLSYLECLSSSGSG